MRYSSTVAVAVGMLENTRSIVLDLLFNFGIVVEVSGSLRRTRSCSCVQLKILLPSCDALRSACHDGWKAFMSPATTHRFGGVHDSIMSSEVSSSGLL